MSRIRNEINNWPDDVKLGVFPEYCWGNSNSSDVLKLINEYKHKLPNKLCLVMGSTSFNLGSGIITNNAIIISKDEKMRFIPKSHTLIGERERSNVQNGTNPGVIRIHNLNIGVLICADLWDAELVKKIVMTHKADILAVPSFTTVPKGYSAYARQQWLSLSISRSREFVIPIIVADHTENGEDYDVGKVSNIADPSKKHPGMKRISDFLDLQKGNTIISTLNFSKIQRYRNYRLTRGLLD